jgi:two-component system, NtrC family, response regulator AtoC
MSATNSHLAEEVLIGNSSAIKRVCDQLQKASSTEVPVLITGESGTGKGLAARLLHNLSKRFSRDFVELSCPAMSNQIFDQIPFAVPNAANVEQEIKIMEGGLTDACTLFLDEIGELDLSLQSKLLHRLQVLHLTGFAEINEQHLNVRLICATNHDLEAEIAKGTFRSDLFYRINVLRIQIPPLRERIVDILPLMNHFIKIYNKRFDKQLSPPSPSFAKALEEYHWPGNIRELENMAKRYVVLGGEEYVLSAMKLVEATRQLTEEVDLTTPLRIQTKRAIQNLESKIILNVLRAHNWNRRKTARSLDISYRTLLYKIKESGLPRSKILP